MLRAFSIKKIQIFAAAILIFFALNSCTPNNPYRSEEKTENTLYSSFDEPPKHMDPAKSYSDNEYAIIGQIYEPPLEYHYLKRPYELQPLTLTKLPEPAYFDAAGMKLPKNASPEKVARVEYSLEIKKGIMYGDHPAFARNADGTLTYAKLTAKDMEDITSPEDFSKKGTKELTSDDYIRSIMRLADPRLGCPIAPILSQYILGFDEFSASVRKEVLAIREERKKAAGASYNKTLDEKQNPIIIDYSKHAFRGLQKTGPYSFKIILKRKYPQFSYWLAMQFFSPVPEEVDLFYSQALLKNRNITLDRFPVGTGAYRMQTFNPRKEIVLVKNEYYKNGFYPVDGEKGDREKGLLNDAGKALPLTDKVVFKLETENIPRWNKFLQGYYDLSGIASDSFDQAISISGQGQIELTPVMKDKNISLLTTVRQSTSYNGFNMLDKTVGGYSEDKKKLRQAITIAIDTEEYIEIFANGRGIPAMSAVPPGIFGHIEGKDGINPYVYAWNSTKNRAERKTLDEAKQLLKEAGYPGGRDKNGNPLTITFDSNLTGVDAAQLVNWYIKKFAALGISLVSRTTDYNRFQEKMANGDFQFFIWGWNADYPDPENFFFLLHGPTGKVKFQGENAANYSNPEFDRLFKIMENMDNSPERLDVIKKMNAISTADSPWTWGFHPVSFTLKHDWVRNYKPNTMSNNSLKYYGIDTVRRAKMRDEWNSPVIWPIAALIVIFVAALLPAILSVRKKLGMSKG